MLNYFKPFPARLPQPYVFFPALLLLLSLSYFACRKSSETQQTSATTNIVESYRSYFESTIKSSYNPDQAPLSASLKATLHKSPDWSRAHVLDLSFGKTVVVPLVYKENVSFQTVMGNISLDSTSTLLLYLDKQDSMHTEVITRMADEAYMYRPIGKFTGVITVENWKGQLQAAYRYGSTSAQALHLIDQPVIDHATRQVTDNRDATCTDYTYYICVDNNCSFIDTYGDDGCSAGGGTGVPGGTIAQKVIYDYNDISNTTGLTLSQILAWDRAFTFAPPSSAISDIPAYTHCFDANGSSYSVALLVNSPAPGQQVAFTQNAPGSVPLYNTGHTFLRFAETLANGAMITRCIGFYPTSTVSAYTQATTSSLGNDGGQHYNAGLTIPVTASQFSAILSYITNVSGVNFAVFSETDTERALEALQQGGINITPPQGIYFDRNASLENYEDYVYESGDLAWYIISSSWPANYTVVNGSMTADPNVGTCN
ncbi:hypothetical protein ACQ86N_03520 [Puia sp. P3]|uniref:hypothetical protein n=1 Tax=Puia sp. P3 TaxID=3423952 RepID=UPI003D669327